MTRVCLLASALAIVSALSACNRESADPTDNRPEPVGAAGLLTEDDLPTDAPFGEWGIEELPSDSAEGIQDPDMPACTDLSQIDASLESELVEVTESPTFAGEADTDVVSMTVTARNTVYDYESADAAQTAFEAIDAALFAECIGRNVTPSERDTVVSHVTGGARPSLGGDGSVVHRVEMSDYTYYGGNDNETGSDLIATKVGASVLVFQLIVSGQALDYLGTDPIESEFETVRAIVEDID